MASAVQFMQRTLADTSTFSASPMGLPMSRVSSSASSSRCSCISVAKRCSTRLRCTGDCPDQLPFSNTRRATATARSASSGPQDATFASTRPSIGLMQSKVSPEAAATCLPSMKAWWGMRCVAARACQSGWLMG